MDKICIKCHEEKNVSEFSFLKEKNGPDNTCKKCKSLYVKNYNKNNKEKVEKRINLKSKENAKTLHLINNKKCSKCNEVKDIDNFSLDKKTNTYCSRCKKCIAECKHFYAINLQKDLDEAKNKKNQIIDVDIINKKCVCCNEIYSLDKFHKKQAFMRKTSMIKIYYSDTCYKCEHKKWYINRKNLSEEELQECRETDRLWHSNNIEYSREYYQNNKDRILNSQTIYRSNNKEKISIRERKNRARYQANKLNKLKSNPEIHIIFKIRNNTSGAINRALARYNSSKNGDSINDCLPYSIIELITHIESLWEPWMNWGNYGVYINGGEKKWHIDHIIPQSFFKYTSMRNEEFQKCWALKKLRPFEAIANIKKSNKVL